MISDAARRRYQAIVPPHVDDAYALARWLSGDPADAEDIVQDAALRALNALETANVERPRAWFLRIVRNTALTWMAKNRSKSLVFRRRRRRSCGDRGRRPRRRRTRLRKRCSSPPRTASACAGRSPRCRQPLREALVLREINGLAYREIAEATETPIGTVMSRLARARAALAKILEDKP